MLTMTATIATVANIVLAYRVGAEGGSTARALFDLVNIANATIGFGALLFLGGVAMGLAQATDLPRWLLPVTGALAVVELISTFQVFPRSGAFAAGSGVLYAFFALFMAWTIAVSVLLLRDAALAPAHQPQTRSYGTGTQAPASA